MIWRGSLFRKYVVLLAVLVSLELIASGALEVYGPHLPVGSDSIVAEEVARVKQGSQEIMRFCVGVGGSITGEHGVGLDKLHHMERLFTGDSLDAMCRLREVFEEMRLRAVRRQRFKSAAGFARQNRQCFI